MLKCFGWAGAGQTAPGPTDQFVIVTTMPSGRGTKESSLDVTGIVVVVMPPNGE